MLPTLMEISAKLKARPEFALELTEQALSSAQDSKGEGGRTFIRVFVDSARAEARRSFERHRVGYRLGPLDGVPVSIKDLFDVGGFTTLAGSRVLTDHSAAAEDSHVVRNLREAGAVVIGSTNMTEFAFSGVGLNPHYGTPANPWDRTARRIPGGSSAGAAISVTDGMASIAFGTDTGGSVRIPAALTGLVGYKPTASRISMTGLTPLSPSLDSVGAIGQSVLCCARAVDVLASPVGLSKAATPRLRLGVLTNYVMPGTDDDVSSAFGAALRALSKAGHILEEVSIPAIDDIPAANQKGGFPAYESFHWHRKLLDRAHLYDPRVLNRILRGKDMSEVDYDELREERQRITGAVKAAISPFDAMLCPTVPIIAPPISAFDAEDEFTRLNLLLLRNPSVVNFIDGAAFSLPCHPPGSAPVGLMVWSPGHADVGLIAVARCIESVLKHDPSEFRRSHWANAFSHI